MDSEKKKDIFIIIICSLLVLYLCRTKIEQYVDLSSIKNAYQSSDKFISDSINFLFANPFSTYDASSRTSLRMPELDVNEPEVQESVPHVPSPQTPTDEISKNLGFNPQIYTLPLLQGAGRVEDLDVAMRKNEKLTKTVQKLSKGATLKELYDNFDEFFAEWAGVSSIPNNAMRGSYPAKKLAIMENFYDDPYVCTIHEKKSTDVPPSGVASLNMAYMKLKSYYFTNFALQTVLDSETGGGQYSLSTYKYIFFSQPQKLPDIFAKMVNKHSDEDLFYLAKIIKVVSEYNPPFKLSDLKNRVPEGKYNLLTNPYAEVNSIQSKQGS